ncbi:MULTISPECIES: RNA polymerase sigma factor [Streptomycetaceae]|uniref:Putative glycerophosphoryl diester phosphodiesterase n=1 Tax=Streptantibioticus cattleyicolor (strain ATCC 35852 / DSM 46488 / JCM 4925 / NBRC 14057 / NRRL 8057) TaxID=1003195 RepID=F8K3T7_STREN|nr:MULTISPECIES: sigma-70 family RNA polymerase sigma factor [Streptomycetaceae]AEW97626.1 putative glycerophosphoryl diester phosphodiesterase [Streptantibioticus cattleyicolor NRRL 8057 = DSM 46488]MYS62055.1 sigma-70 family RNA polymerase sigma factor [Streptomyces sp. SID5468]CCB77948.1 RNA polymerase sigma factor [Streptantibioticus cattleyicolor NRRL 8057 = DSM 46488]
MTTLPTAWTTFATALAAEAAAEAGPAGVEAADLEQAVWLRWLEHGGPAPVPDRDWLREAVRGEARAARRRAGAEVPCGTGPVVAAPSAESQALQALRGRSVREAVRRLPGRCGAVLSALLSASDPTYREISRELGISQGALGPLRSRCLGCLRASLRSEVEPLEPRGKER